MDEEYNRRVRYVIDAARDIDARYGFGSDETLRSLLRTLHYALITLDSYNKRVQ